MCGFNKTRIGMVLALVVASGAPLSIPTEASAQVDYGRIIGSILAHQYAGYRGHSSSNRSRSHEPSGHDSSDKDISDHQSINKHNEDDVKIDRKNSIRQASSPSGNAKSYAQPERPERWGE
jgi:hypothetical protein